MTKQASFSRNQKICFWSMYLGFCITSGFAVFEHEGWGDAPLAVYPLMLFCWAVCAVPIYYWVRRNPETVDRLFY